MAPSRGPHKATGSAGRFLLSCLSLVFIGFFVLLVFVAINDLSCNGHIPSIALTLGENSYACSEADIHLLRFAFQSYPSR